MELKEFASLLGKREYAYPQFTDEEIKIAKDNGFVIVYGASDDLIELEGAINDEGGCFNGGKIYFDINGIACDENDTTANMIEAVWCGDDKEDDPMFSWTYKTDIPHEEFFIYEYGEPYCMGIVFSVDDVK